MIRIFDFQGAALVLLNCEQVQMEFCVNELKTQAAPPTRIQSLCQTFILHTVLSS